MLSDKKFHYFQKVINAQSCYFAIEKPQKNQTLKPCNDHVSLHHFALYLLE